MPKVLIATDKPFAPVAVKGIKEILQKAGYEIAFLEKYKTTEEYLNAVKDADALIVRSDLVNQDVINAAQKLKIVIRAGAGYDNIDLPACTSKGIIAMNTPGQNSNAVAELAFGMMVYMARTLFSGASGTELRAKTLGLHAFGNVSRYMAKIAKGFGMIVSAYDPHIDKKIIEDAGVKAVSNLEELYSANQYISLHIPANKETKGSIGFNLLSKMPEGATLVNTARKEVIDETGLLKMFAERKDFRYVADVEPDCKTEVAEKYAGRFYFTPKKMGAQTEEANINAGLAAARQIVGFFEKGDKTYQVNK
jgi:D-3-phosphoglycerate dehydrogenase / 2-oxoglutarate reductase